MLRRHCGVDGTRTRIGPFGLSNPCLLKARGTSAITLRHHSEPMMYQLSLRNLSRMTLPTMSIAVDSSIPCDTTSP